MSKKLLGTLELNRIYQFNCIDGLKLLPENSVNMCVTSPPYWGLRDYGVNGQLGLEETPEQYVKNMVDVFREVKRVLKDDGTLWLNLGDSYAGSMKGYMGNGEWADRTGTKQGTNVGSLGIPPTKAKEIGLKPKDLVGIPWRVAFALQADGWYLRSDIIWHKPNAMPESVKDRPTKAHEYIFLLSKSPKYYYDADSIREPYQSKPTNKLRDKNAEGYQADYTQGDRFSAGARNYYSKGKRNKRTVWKVSTKPFKGAHFATFPPDLIEPCILAGCPEEGIVLDPFMGSGTTAIVALKNNRNFIGFEINPKYIEIANMRIEATYNENDDQKILKNSGLLDS